MFLGQEQLFLVFSDLWNSKFVRKYFHYMLYGSSASKLFNPYFYFLGFILYTRSTWECLLFFFFDYNLSNKNSSFCFLFLQKNSDCTIFLQTATWNLSNYSGCFPKIFLAFQSIEAVFESYFTKVVF